MSLQTNASGPERAVDNSEQTSQQSDLPRAPVLRMRQLDSLRAFAVLAVLVHHFLPVWKIFPEDFLTLGLLGVRFFFTLSGFLITGILLRGQPLGTFYFRRAIRIFPAYYACLLLVVILGVPDARQFFWYHLFYLSNVVFAFQHVSGSTVHFWSLAVEEQFYLVWPWLLRGISAKNAWKLPLAAILTTFIYKTAIAFTLGAHAAGGFLTLGCLDSLGLGALLACFGHDSKLKPHRELFLRWSLICGVLIVAIQVGLHAVNRGQRLFYSTAYLGVSLIFVWVVAQGADGKLWKGIEARPLLYTGKISYGLYLWHNFALAFVIWFWGYRPSAWIAAPVATLLTYVVAATSWKLLESPLNTLKERYSNREKTPPVVAALENTAGGI